MVVDYFKTLIRHLFCGVTKTANG